MAAPALVALAHGSRDPRSAATITALVDEVRAMRPDLASSAAFLELSKPSFDTGGRPARPRRHDEIVVVPLLLTEAYHAKVDVPSAVAAAMARHERLQIRATSILGLEPASSRCSTCGCARRSRRPAVRELDALVLAAAGSCDPLANQAVARLARLWGTTTSCRSPRRSRRLPPATGEAVRAFRGGPPPHRRRLAVPGPRLPARPGRRARPRGRRRRGVRAARRAPRDRPRDPGPVRRRAVELVPV